MGIPMGVPFSGGDFLIENGGSPPTERYQGQLPLNKLVAPFASQMLVEGIRFRAETSAANTDEALSLRVRVNAGQFSLTNDFIAPAGVAEREQYAGGEVGATPGLATPALSELFTSFGGTGVNWAGAQYTWRFPEPLYLPAGVPLRISLKRDVSGAREDLFFASQPVAIGAVGTYATLFGQYFPQRIAPPPGPVPIPFASSFVDPAAVLLSSPPTTKVTSSEIDLCNRTAQTFYADKLIGRLPARSFGGVQNAIGEYTGPEPLVRVVRTYSGGRMPGGYGGDAFARANNRPIVDPLKPFNSVFPIATRAIDLTGVELPPNACFVASVLKQTSQTALEAQIRIFPVFGLTGYRMEDWGGN